jgi:uncharacterized metal-binding protein YceD (DUF177 family)
MKSTAKTDERLTAECARCGNTFELPLAKNYEYKRQRKYCSDECQYATAREKQAATNAARKLAEQQAQAEQVKQAEVVAGTRKVNYYKEVHRKARLFARQTDAPKR